MFLRRNPPQDETIAGNLDLTPNLFQVLIESFAELEAMQTSPQKVVLVKNYRDVPLGGATDQI
jgi:hypothetical protein